MRHHHPSLSRDTCLFVLFFRDDDHYMRFAFQSIFAHRTDRNMKRSVTYLILFGVLLVGAGGKFWNGPWLINRLRQIATNRIGGQGLSPVIFGEQILFLSRVSNPKFKFEISYQPK